MEQSKLFYEQFEERFQMKDPTYLTVDNPIRYVGFDISLHRKSGTQYVSIDQDDDVKRFLGGIELPSVYRAQPAVARNTEKSTRPKRQIKHPNREIAQIAPAAQIWPSLLPQQLLLCLN